MCTPSQLRGLGTPSRCETDALASVLDRCTCRRTVLKSALAFSVAPLIGGTSAWANATLAINEVAPGVFVHQGRYELQSGPPLRRIDGQTLGIVGLGAIGARLAQRAISIGLSVVATNRSGRTELTRVRMCGLDELLRQSDYVSLHVPLTDQTRHLIGRDALTKLKPTAYLINTSRGGVVDHAALAEALAAGRLAGAALDVQEKEPPDLSQPPYNDPRVIVTPHAAFYSEESVAELRRRVAEQVVARLLGEIPENVVNPEVL